MHHQCPNCSGSHQVWNRLQYQPESTEAESAKWLGCRNKNWQLPPPLLLQHSYRSNNGINQLNPSHHLRFLRRNSLLSIRNLALQPPYLQQPHTHTSGANNFLTTALPSRDILHKDISNRTRVRTSYGDRTVLVGRFQNGGGRIRRGTGCREHSHSGGRKQSLGGTRGRLRLRLINAHPRCDLTRLQTRPSPPTRQTSKLPLNAHTLRTQSHTRSHHMPRFPPSV